MGKNSKKKEKKGLKKDCCEKYLKKDEHKRRRSCPCFDMIEAESKRAVYRIGNNARDIDPSLSSSMASAPQNIQNTV